MAKNTNVAIASFTACHARLKLFECMETAGLENIHYCDTDSLIYSYKEGANPISIDNQLGGMTDELIDEEKNDKLKPGDLWITELVCLAPKTYSYKVNNGKIKMKAKGFKMTSDAEDTVSFANMRKMVDDLYKEKRQADVEQHQVEYDNIRIDPRTKLLHNKKETKTFRLCFNKREIDFENSTGYRLPTTSWKSFQEFDKAMMKKLERERMERKEKNKAQRRMMTSL